MKKNIIIIKIFICLSFVLSVNLFAELTGDIKEYVIFKDANTIGQDSINSYTSLRLKFNKEVNDKYLFDVAYEIGQLASQKKSIGVFPFLSIFPYLPYRVRDFNIVPVNKTHYELYQNLDRLLVNVNLSKADITIGRQPIALGIAKTVSPFDIIIPYPYYAIDKEYRLGVDAIRTVISLSDLTEIDCGYVSGKNFSFDKSLFYFQTTVNVNKADIGAIFSYFQDNLMVGMNLQRPIGDAGFWLEGAYVFAGKSFDVFKGKDYFRLTTGIDYKFTKEIYAFLEYHYNGAGVNDKNSYRDNLYQIAYVEGEVYFLGKHYFMPGVNVELTPLVNLKTLLVFNYSDYSFSLSGDIEYNVSENLYLDFNALIDVGKSNTEFQLYPSRYYAALRYYF